MDTPRQRPLCRAEKHGTGCVSPTTKSFNRIKTLCYIIDLALAAEIGQSLVTANEDLKAQLDASLLAQMGATVQGSTTTSSDSGGLLKTIVGLEEAQQRIESRLDDALNAVESHKESERVAIRNCRNAESTLAETLTEMKRLSSTLSTSQDQLSKLQNDKKELAHQVQVWKTRAATHSSASKDTQDMIQGLESELNLALMRIQESDKRVVEAQAHITELEGQLDEFYELKESFEAQKMAMDQVQWELDRTREALSSAQSQLNQSSGLALSGPAPKTLLSEVDDKRQQAESQVSELSVKHQGLLKAHSLTVQQQERMRNHISRLTQLSQNQSAEHRVVILEDALSQALSENQTLERRLINMEKTGGSTGYLNDTDEDTDDTSSDATPPKLNGPGHGSLDLDSLRLRVHHLTLENNALSKELSTLHLIKMNETDKARIANARVHERELELDQVRCLYAQVKFELEEVKLRGAENGTEIGAVELSQDETGEMEEADVSDTFQDEVPDTSYSASQLSIPPEDDPDFTNPDLQKVIALVESVSPASLSTNASNSSTRRSSILHAVVDAVETPPLSMSSSPRTTTSGHPRRDSSGTKNVKLDRSKMGQECNQQ